VPLKHFEQFQPMLLILLFSEIKIELKLKAKFMVGFVQINLVNFTFNLFLLHLILILPLKPFVIMLNFKVLLAVEIIKYFISPYFVVFQIRGLKIRAFVITQLAGFLLELEDLVAP
jgi:hypothetical protein